MNITIVADSPQMLRRWSQYYVGVVYTGREVTLLVNWLDNFGLMVLFPVWLNMA